MSPLQLLVLAGMVLAGGLVVLVRALRPAPPGLDSALAQLSATPTLLHEPTPSRGRWEWLPSGWSVSLNRYLRVPDADLRLVGWTRESLAARSITLALLGLLLPSILSIFASVMGLNLPVVFPALMGLVLAFLMWRIPSSDVKSTAAQLRAQFRAALASYLDLVALERVARGSVPEALESAADISGSEPFQHIRMVLQHAALAGQTPWEALRQLGEHFDIDELRNLGAIAEVAADGAAVYKTLLAESRSLRHAELAHAREEANKASERMSIPVALLTTGLMAFVFVPFILRLLTGTGE